MKDLHIVVSPNAYKHSLTAEEAAKAIADGIQESGLSSNCTLFPVGDGGDGTAELLTGHLRGKLQYTLVKGPLGAPVNAAWGLVEKQQRAIIGLANSSGLKLIPLKELNPLVADTYGTGEVFRAALQAGAKEVLLCVGGSATLDAGTGILRALGVRFLDAAGTELTHIAEYHRLDRISTDNVLPAARQMRVKILCDVISKLTGDGGAIQMFGPQKGASPADILHLTAVMNRFMDVVKDQFNVDLADLPSGGAAGGVSAVLYGILGATLENGISHFLEITRFSQLVEKADLVITGEGALDLQTLQGKAPFGVALQARMRQVPVIGVAGFIDYQAKNELKQYFDVLLSITNGPNTLEDAIKTTAGDLKALAREIGDLLYFAPRIKA